MAHLPADRPTVALLRGQLLELRAVDAERGVELGVVRAENTESVSGRELAVSPRSWLELAACRGRDTSWWFAGDSFGRAVAVSICRRCSVCSECLHAALVEEAAVGRYERSGIRGGKTPAERVALRTS